jgi:hypothetical protein
MLYILVNFISFSLGFFHLYKFYKLITAKNWEDRKEPHRHHHKENDNSNKAKGNETIIPTYIESFSPLF